MKTSVASFSGMLALASLANAASLLSTSDFIIPIDNIPTPSASRSPGWEGISNIFSPDLGSKYFNYGGSGSGFIAILPEAVPMGSFTVSTANDYESRDPSSYQIWGTNGEIFSGPDSDGLQETWTLVSEGTLSLPDNRYATSGVISTGSQAAYKGWKVVFPATKGGDIYFQISNFSAYQNDGGLGESIFTPDTSVMAIDAPAFFSASPQSQGVVNLLDGDPFTKYLNFGKHGTGFIVTPVEGASILTEFTLTTADDAASLSSRNPTSYAIYGTNQSILSAPHSDGSSEAWTLIASGALDLPAVNTTQIDPISLENTTPYLSYKMVFPTLVDGLGFYDDSIQLADVHFEGTLVPEASVAVSACIAAAALGMRRRRM